MREGMGGYRISNELKVDLIDINRLAETTKTIAEITEGLNNNDRKKLIINARAIKEILSKHVKELTV